MVDSAGFRVQEIKEVVGMRTKVDELHDMLKKSQEAKRHYFNNNRGIARLVRDLAYSELGQSSDAELDSSTAITFSESEKKSFKNVFGVIDSPF